jgi:hypothetical protein
MIFIGASFVLYYLFIISHIKDWQTRGQIGDTFGTLNALFSALAFFGVVYSILQQNESIKQSKLELQNDVAQTKESVRQFEQQQKIQSLLTLISIWEKKVADYENKGETQLSIEANRKLMALSVELENFIK